MSKKQDEAAQLGNAPPRSDVGKLSYAVVDAVFGVRGQEKHRTTTALIIARVLNTHLDALVPAGGALVEALRQIKNELGVPGARRSANAWDIATNALAQAQQPAPAVALGLDAQREADVRLAQYLMQRSANPDDSPWGEHDIANWIGDWRRAEAEA